MRAYLSSFSTLVSFFPASLSSATTSLATAASRFSEILRDRQGEVERREEAKEGKRGVIGEGKKRKGRSERGKKGERWRRKESRKRKG